MDTQTELIVGMIKDIGAKVDARAQELRSDVAEVHARVDGIVGWTGKHEVADTKAFGEISTRLDRVEGTRKAIIWLAGALVTALLAGAADVAVNHFEPDARKPVRAESGSR